jgi:hypothetical protein
LALRLALGTAVIAAGAAALWALAAGPAAAKPGHVQLKLAHGSLRVAVATRVLLSSGTATVTVTDARGTGGGWSLKLNAARPVSIARVVASCASGSTCTLPRAKVVASGDVVLRALRGTGMGVIRLQVTFGQLHTAKPSATPVTFSVLP